MSGHELSGFAASLKSHLATELVDGTVHGVSTICAKSNVRQALEKLTQASIYSAPVWCETDKKCLGLVDLGDMTAFMVSLFYKDADVSTSTDLWKVSTSNFEGGKISEAFFSAPITSVINFSNSNPYSPLPAATATLYDVLIALNKHRRVPLVDADGVVVRIIAQSTFVRWLGSKPSLLLDFGQKTLTELNAITRPLVTIPANVRAIDAFALIADRHFSSVSLRSVDGEPVTIGTLTVKDLGLVCDNFAFVVASVEDFLKIIRQKNLHTTYPTMGVAPEAHLVDVVRKMQVTKVHRLLIHSPNADYSGLVSLGDIVRAITRHL